MLPWQPIKFNDLDKIHMNRRGLLKKYFYKKSKCLQWDSKNCQFPLFPIISQVVIATRLLIRLGQKKTILFVHPAYRCYMWNMVRIGVMSSDEMFENVNDGRTTMTDGRQMPAYTISSLMSLRLRWAKITAISMWLRWKESENSKTCTDPEKKRTSCHIISRVFPASL